MPITKKADIAHLSNIYIPIKFAKKDLEGEINQQIGEVLFEEHNMNGDNIKVKAIRTDSIKLSLKDSTILYSVPLDILVGKKIALLGNTEATGSLVLYLATQYRLNEDWTIQTTTKIEDYEWIEKPKLSVLGASLPISAIANRILLYSKERITGEIDRMASEGLSLKQYAAAAWEQIQQPMLVSEAYQSYLKITPRSLFLAPFKQERDTIVTTLFVQGLSEVSVGNTTTFAPNAALPPLKVQALTPKPYEVRLLAKIPFKELEKVAMANLKGEIFEIGKKKITIDSLSIEKTTDKLAVDVLVSGDYYGMLYFKGIPSFDERNNRIDIEKVEFRLESKNFLLKTAKWLFTDLIINKIETNLQYYIDEDLEEIKKQIHQQFSSYEIQPGIFVKGEVLEIKILDVSMDTDYVHVIVSLNGLAEVIARKDLATPR